MDELDNDKPQTSLYAGAGAALAAMAGLAMAATRRKEDGTMSGPGIADLESIVAQVADLAPEVADALEPHAPGLAKSIRERVPVMASAGGKALSLASVLASERTKNLRKSAAASASGVWERRRSVSQNTDHLIDAGRQRFTDVQERAAEVAAREVERAQRFVDGATSDDSSDDDRLTAERVAEMVRDAAREAAEQTAQRFRQFETADRSSRFAIDPSAMRHLPFGNRDLPAVDAYALHDEDAPTADDDASEAARPVESSKGGGAWLWFAALAGLVAYLLYSPARREKVGAVLADASASAQEILRDVRGYDDEF